MLEPLKRNLRPLTHFICKELLYDYQRGKLDKDRHMAVEKYLEQNPELKKDLEIYKTALSYTDNLARTKVVDSYILELKEVKSFQKKMFQKMRWSKLPEVTRWMIEGFVLSACVMLMGIVLPWDKMAEFWPNFKTKFEPHNESKVQEPSNSITIVAAPTDSKKINDKTEDAVKPTETAATDTKVERVKPVAPTVAPEQTPTVVAAKTVNVDNKNNLKSESSSATTVDKNKNAAVTGFLYSMNMKMKYDSSALGLIKKKLIELGAIKAGQVGLGWRKLNPPGSYYHFSLPENKYPELIKLLEQFSTLRSYKNVHPRIMPEGQVRVILWIEDIVHNKTKNNLIIQDSSVSDETDPKSENTPKENVDVMDQEGQ
jgi:hypothetical protein